MRFSKAVVRCRIPILIITLLLLIPCVFGMINTRINYDMLDYLPGDMDTVKGQETLLEDFGKGAFSFIIVEDMPRRDVAKLTEKSKRSTTWKPFCGTTRWRTSPFRWKSCRMKSTANSTPITPP